MTFRIRIHTTGFPITFSGWTYPQSWAIGPWDAPWLVFLLFFLFYSKPLLFQESPLKEIFSFFPCFFFVLVRTEKSGGALIVKTDGMGFPVEWPGTGSGLCLFRIVDHGQVGGPLAPCAFFDKWIFFPLAFLARSRGHPYWAGNAIIGPNPRNSIVF